MFRQHVHYHTHKSLTRLQRLPLTNKPKMDITDTLNPILTYATLTASCALQTNLRFSTIKWIISSIALLLYILEMVMIVRITNFEEAVSKTKRASSCAYRLMSKRKCYLCFSEVLTVPLLLKYKPSRLRVTV